MSAANRARLARLLVFNLMTDADHPVLGFTTNWLNALAERCDSLDVITMQMGRLAVADNVRVYSVGKERGYSEPRRAIEFYRILARLLAENGYQACFAHMMPLFALMGSPLLRPRRIPITLWYAHKSVTRILRAAEKQVDHVVTASAESFRLSSRKVILIGHGIDTRQFAPLGETQPHPFTFGTIGRIGPTKQTDHIIEAARILIRDGVTGFGVRIVGGPLPGDEAYAAGLRQSAADFGLMEAITFVGAVSFERVADEYRRIDVMLNLSLTGSIDKAVLEAMACGIPVITANEAFVPLLAAWRDLLLVPHAAPDILAARLRKLMAMPAAERQSLGLALRQIVVEGHSLDRLMDRLVSLWAVDRPRTIYRTFA
jgi:glycosyltransferase involved in cell wall biosynthesis